jgi:AraC-like DNA-binding protein
MLGMAQDGRRARLLRPCRVPAGLKLALEQQGLSAPAVTRRAGLPEQTLDEPRPWLTIDGYFALWEAIAACSEDPLLGIRLGRQYPEHVLEPAFLAWLGSRDLADAVNRLRYKRTLCPETLSLKQRDDRVELHYEWPTASRSPPPILVEAELSFLLHLGRKATRQELRGARLRLTRRGNDPAPYSAALSAEVQLGAGVGTLSLRAADLALPFQTFNPSLLAVLDPALAAEQSLSWTPGADSVASVRQVLTRRLAEGEVALRQVAGELNTTTRTLQRQMREAGTSFAELLQDTRRERAAFYLQKSQLSFSEISFLLGFDTPSSFFRAFARWTGQTPRAFRDSATSIRR